MTTATAWFVRGNFLASLYTQPGGFLFALLITAAFWISLYIATTGRPTYRLLNRLPINKLLFAGLLFLCAGWGWKILIHLSGIDGWH